VVCVKTPPGAFFSKRPEPAIIREACSNTCFAVRTTEPPGGSVRSKAVFGFLQSAAHPAVSCPFGQQHMGLVRAGETPIEHGRRPVRRDRAAVDDEKCRPTRELSDIEIVCHELQPFTRTLRGLANP